MSTGSPKDIAAATLPPPYTGRGLRQSNYTRIVQNFRLIWLDTNIDEMSDNDWRGNVTRLRHIINSIDTFTDAEQCMKFLTNIKDETVFLIVTGYVGQHIVPIVHNMSQLDSIYILCVNKSRHEQWVKQWFKIKGVFTEISSICDALKKAAQQYDQNAIPVSFVSASDDLSNQNLDRLDQSFMYTQILKEILLNINFDESHIKDFTNYCRELFVGNDPELSIINEFEQNYRQHSPIWWYTYGSFLYSMLNRALRLMDIDIILRMGFFISDLYRHIAQLHLEQFNSKQQSQPFIVYRGQGFFKTDFDKLLKTTGGIISFNNFLSTSKDKLVSMAFAESNQSNPDLVAVLFEITIDPNVPSVQFALINDNSYYPTEHEILFSMHAVFRIAAITKMTHDNPLWKVEITLTNDDDQRLLTLTIRIRQETQGYTGWHQLAILLIKLAKYDKAQQLLELLLSQTSDPTEEAHTYHMLGITTDDQGQYLTALSFYEKALEINQKTLPPNHPDLATSYSNIGLVYSNMGEYSKALSFYEKALGIYQETLPPNHPHLATSYRYIGQVYNYLGEYAKALSYQEKGQGIYEKSLSSSHPSLARCYSNIGEVYNNMGEYAKALSSQEKALGMREETLPPNHPDLAISYSNIGEVYSNTEYSKALTCHEKALQIREKSLHSMHPDVAICYNNIGLVYSKMGEHSKALSFYEKAIDIRQRTLPPNHPHLATSYNNMGKVYENIGEYTKAASFYQRAMDIGGCSLPESHPHLQLYREHMESVKSKL